MARIFTQSITINVHGATITLEHVSPGEVAYRTNFKRGSLTCSSRDQARDNGHHLVNEFGLLLGCDQRRVEIELGHLLFNLANPA